MCNSNIILRIIARLIIVFVHLFLPHGTLDVGGFVGFESQDEKDDESKCKEVANDDERIHEVDVHALGLVHIQTILIEHKRTGSTTSQAIDGKNTQLERLFEEGNVSQHSHEVSQLAERNQKAGEEHEDNVGTEGHKGDISLIEHCHGSNDKAQALSAQQSHEEGEEEGEHSHPRELLLGHDVRHQRVEQSVEQWH